MPILRLTAALSIPLFAAVGCGTPAHLRPLEERPTSGAAEYAFVFLKRGSYRPVDPDEGRELNRGHFENMSRLAERGVLLVAGPFGSTPDPRLAGVFVFDTPDLDEARELTASDPAIAAGVFDVDVVRWVGPAALRRMKSLEEGLRADLPAAERANPGATLRPFVLATCDDPEEASRTATALGAAVACGGPLFGAKDIAWLGVLDAETAEAAAEQLEAAGARTERWVLLPWFSSRAILAIDEPGRDP